MTDSDWKARAEKAEARVAKLEARLEIDHAFRLQDDKLVRFEIPAEERDAFPDKITCLEAEIADLRDEDDEDTDPYDPEPID